MDDVFLVYDLVSEKLGNGYEHKFYQSMRSDREGDVGIYLYISSNDLEDLSGNEVYNSVKVHVQVNCEAGDDGLKKALNYLTEFTHKIENEVSNTPGIEIVSAQHIGPRALPIGRNEHNILICKSDVDLKYEYK